jgi:hypothetical protein
MFDPTLLGLLSQVDNGQIVLPAMQRPFIWKEERIYRLIDSLLRGFPIGAVMLWQTNSVQRFRKILKNIDNENSPSYTYETTRDNESKYLVLDGQQRLTSLFTAFHGTYNSKQLYIDVLSGDSENKDPGDEYFDCQFMTQKYADELNNNCNGERRHYEPIEKLIRNSPVNAVKIAHKRAIDLKLKGSDIDRIADTYIRCAAMLGSKESLQVIFVDNDPTTNTPLEEILEIFVRVNSGGMVLQKSDLLMSLLDLKWNDIQPELQKVVKCINQNKPFEFTRDDVLKSLLLAVGSETRFDKLVGDRIKVEKLAEILPNEIPSIQRAWQMLSVILTDDCKIYSERFFNGGHRSLLPFVLYLSQVKLLSNADKKKIVIGIYLAVMSGIFAGAEARMGGFTRNVIKGAKEFPLKTHLQRAQPGMTASASDSAKERTTSASASIASRASAQASST